MKIRLGLLTGEVSRCDGWLRLGRLGVRWRPADGRLFSQRGRGLVVGKMWVGILR